MTAETTDNRWAEANLQYLTACVAVVRARLTARGDRNLDGPEVARGSDALAAAEAAVRIANEALPAPSAIDVLCDVFALSPFERDVLLFAAAAELDTAIAEACASAARNPRVSAPTLGLALAIFPGAHWTALTPIRPLRRWRLIDIAAGDGLLTSAIRIDERALHYLTGVPYLDDCLQHVVERIAWPDSLPHSYLPLAERIVDAWSRRAGTWPVVHLAGDAGGGKRRLAAACCRAVDLQLHAMRAGDLPSSTAELGGLIRLWQREALLSRSALLIESGDADDPATTRLVRMFVDRAGGPVFVSGRVALTDALQGVVRVEVSRPSSSEQRSLWESALGSAAERLNGQLDAVAAQFRLDVDVIEATGRTLEQTPPEDDTLGARIWETCRTVARADLDRLAERIDARSTWDDLVLPEEPRETLREIAAQVRQRRTVYETWGFAQRSDRGVGISALFAGPSGTGKTLAAEVLASELRLDLYRIDLSQVVSKYIGETEKNLRAIFAAAEHSGAILLFDEADALFGKRTEVHDSHDRYANIEVSYLLQRMEAYSGLAVLTTNRRNALDAAFLRRLRFVVTFPFPDAAQRAQIWQRTFPSGTPLDRVDVQQLARLNVAGGNIRNIALNAAFLAADLGEPIRMSHLLRTARSECIKLDKPLAAAEIGGWV